MKVAKLFILLTFPILMGVNFASCSDDDNDEVPFDNSAVVGNWDFTEVTSAFEFSDAFIKDKSEEDLKGFTALVETYLTEVRESETAELESSKFKLAKEFTFELQIKNDKGELVTEEGIYVLDPAFKHITFTLSNENSRKFDLDGVNMTYNKEISGTDISLGTGETSGIKGDDIKSASTTQTYIKKSK